MMTMIMHTLTCLYGGGFVSLRGSSWLTVCNDVHCLQATVASVTAARTQHHNTHYSITQSLIQSRVHKQVSMIT